MPDRSPPEDQAAQLPRRKMSRRQLLVAGLGGAVVIAGAGAGGVELVSRGVLPGKFVLDQLDGACSVSGPRWEFSRPGPEVSGDFYSKARHRRVGYTIGYPPGHRPGDPLSFIVMLHGWGGNHRDALGHMTPARAVAMKVDGKPLPPMALVTVDGGKGYWNPHPGDDPMSMVIDELIPMCQGRGLGRPPHRIATMGISMGGYGAILLAERFPKVFSAVAAISPAIWLSYQQARAANPTAYASAADFAANDALTHAKALAGIPVRVAAGVDDPFYPDVVKFVKALPPGAVVHLGKGCHSGPFFHQQEPPSLAFLGHHIVP